MGQIDRAYAMRRDMLAARAMLQSLDDATIGLTINGRQAPRAIAEAVRHGSTLRMALQIWKESCENKLTSMGVD